MANEAVRDVTIRVNVVAGNIEKQDLTWLSTAREDAEKLRKETDSIVESQKVLGDTERSLLTVTKELTEAHKNEAEEAKKASQEQTAAKEKNAETQRRIAELTKEESIRLNKEALEQIDRQDKEAAERRIAREKEVQAAYDKTKQFDTPENKAAQADRQSRMPITEPGQVNLARQQKDQGAADAAAKKQADDLADALRERHEESETERTAISEREGNRRARQAQRDADEIAREEEQLADRAEAAARRLPQAWNQVTGGIMGTSAAAAKLGLHLAMLSNNGGKDTEELAKKFVEIQAKIGLITETKSLFGGIGKTLNDLQRAGQLTQAIVAQQQALVVATTFSQAATMRLAGAAATAQAAMGPIAIAAAAIVAAYVAWDYYIKSLQDSEETVAKRKEEHLANYDRMLKRIHESLEHEKTLLQAQLSIIENQWSVKKLLLNDKDLTPGQVGKEAEEKTQIRAKQMQQGLRQFAQEGFDDQDAIDERKRLKFKLMDAEEVQSDARAKMNMKGGPQGEEDIKEILRLGKKVQEAKAEIENFESTRGLDQRKALAGTKVDETGVIADLKGMIDTINSLPGHLRDEGTKLLDLAASQQQEVMAQNEQAIQSLQQAEREAKSKKKDIDGKIKAENERFGKEEDTAAGFGSIRGKVASDMASQAFDRFDEAKTVDEKNQAAKSARRALENAGLLTADMDKELRGSNTDTGRARKQLEDDKVVDVTERRTTDEEIKKLTDAGLEAQNVIETAPRLVKSLTDKLKEISRQQEELRQAIENRD